MLGLDEAIDKAVLPWFLLHVGSAVAALVSVTCFVDVLCDVFVPLRLWLLGLLWSI